MDWCIALAVGKFNEPSPLCVRFCREFSVRSGHRNSHARELGDFERSSTVAAQFHDDIANIVSALDVRDLRIRARKRNLGAESLARGDEDFFRSLNQRLSNQDATTRCMDDLGNRHIDWVFWC